MLIQIIIDNADHIVYHLYFLRILQIHVNQVVKQDIQIKERVNALKYVQQDIMEIKEFAININVQVQHPLFMQMTFLICVSRIVHKQVMEMYQQENALKYAQLVKILILIKIIIYVFIHVQVIHFLMILQDVA